MSPRWHDPSAMPRADRMPATRDTSDLTAREGSGVALAPGDAPPNRRRRRRLLLVLLVLLLAAALGVGVLAGV